MRSWRFVRVECYKGIELVAFVSANAKSIHSDYTKNQCVMLPVSPDILMLSPSDDRMSTLSVLV